MVNRVLILGGAGMLGHKLSQVLGQSYETIATVREAFPGENLKKILPGMTFIGGVFADNFDSVFQCITSTKPDVIVNCIGVVKQIAEAKDIICNININALFPNLLARLCCAQGIRLITLSTDCVFSGSRGNYREDDRPDPIDVYGYTKLLGEIDKEHCLTIRTSMIGRQFSGTYGLVEWILSQNGGSVKGFKRAKYTGFTTNSLARIIDAIISFHPQLAGIWHVASEPISKFDLLNLIKMAYNLKVTIEPEDTFICDRSLNSDKFKKLTGIVPPSWAEMIERMQNDHTPYDQLRMSSLAR